MSLEIEKRLRTLKSILEFNKGREDKEWRRLGEKLYRVWTEGGAIASPTGLLAGEN
jgi:hypothetical protein